MKSSKTSQVKQTFSVTAPGALNVMLVGDFTHWQQQPIPMKKKGGGLWQVSVALEPGTHHYRFLVDGNWKDDPECTIRVDTPYGSQNSVRVV